MSEKVASLVLLRAEQGVWLAMKKRGMGAGRWNGYGGKVEPGETIEAAMIRECTEESGVRPVRYHKVAELDFTLNAGTAQAWHMFVHTFICNEWEGEPVETEEMAPQRFTEDTIPYEEMWDGDDKWMPLVLAGHLIRAALEFDENDKLLNHTITEVTEF